VQTDTEGGFSGPATNVELTTNLVRKRDTGSTEDVSLDVHSPVHAWERRIFERRVKLVSTSAVLRASHMLLKELNLAVDTHRGDERNDNTWNQHLVFSSGVALSICPLRNWLVVPRVPGKPGTTTANVTRITGANNVALSFRSRRRTPLPSITLITAEAFFAILHTTSSVT